MGYYDFDPKKPQTFPLTLVYLINYNKTIPYFLDLGCDFMFLYFFDLDKYADKLLSGKIDVIKMENTTMVEPHVHEFFEFVYVLKGHAKHHINNKDCDLSAGDYVVIDYNSSHSYYDSENFTIINCLFLPELIDETFKNVSDFNDLTNRFLFKINRLKLTQNPANQIYHDTDGRVRKIFEDMLTEYEERQVGCLEILKCLLKELIMLTVRHNESVSSISPFTETIIAAVDERYNEHLTLGKICEEAHYSLPYTSGKFKAETGMTFTEYLQRKRIAESCRLLTESEMSIIDIAESVGYTNIKFFNKVFKETTKTTPREYRKQMLTTMH